MELYPILSYINHIKNGRNEHSLHSPFLFRLYNDAVKGNSLPGNYDVIESRRRELLQSKATITIEDHGAGSRINNSKTRKVKDIARNSLKSKKEAAIFYRLAEYVKAIRILELGTSFGLTTSYLAGAAPSVTTIEGCKDTFEIASETFDKTESAHVENIHSTFTKYLVGLDVKEKFDLVLMDGHHAYEPSLAYFELLKPHLTDKAIIVLDDIYWSKDMTKAWNKLRNNHLIDVSINFYHFGLLIKNKDLSSQHYFLRL